MPNFENELCKAINNSFKEKGIAYRRKQARYTSQIFDILVDHPKKYMVIECKSISTKATNKLYQSQHFSNNQIDRESKFAHKSGRDAFLSVELRRGRGKPREAYIVFYDWVDKVFNEYAGISIDTIRTSGVYSQIPRNGDYHFENFLDFID